MYSDSSMTTISILFSHYKAPQHQPVSSADQLWHLWDVNSVPVSGSKSHVQENSGRPRASGQRAVLDYAAVSSVSLEDKQVDVHFQ